MQKYIIEINGETGNITIRPYVGVVGVFSADPDQKCWTDGIRDFEKVNPISPQDAYQKAEDFRVNQEEHEKTGNILVSLLGDLYDEFLKKGALEGLALDRAKSVAQFTEAMRKRFVPRLGPIFTMKA